MYASMRRKDLVLSFVYLLEIIPLISGLEYDYKTFNVQPNPIQFLKEPHDHFTLSSVDVTFVCSLTISNKFSEISWVYNSTKIIKTGDHYNVSSKDQSISTLTIRNVSTKDQGDYHCFVSEWKTKVRSKPGRLHVIDHGSTSDYNDENYTINAVYKSIVILPCNLQLRPSTNPVWFKNHLVLDLKEFNDMSYIDKSGNLILVNDFEVHNGHYQCQVNESGTTRIESSYILTVKQPTENLDDPGKFSSQYLLIVPNHCDKSPNNQTVTLQCPVTGHPSPVIRWYLNGELVNLTDYNITDNVGNNTWIIQGGDPCILIGYWQCFATNEAGTVHYEIRVLPYGWSNPPGETGLKVDELTEKIINNTTPYDNSVYLDNSVHVNISWSPPQYFGGLNASDIYYQLQATSFDIYQATDYDEINTTDTYYKLFYDDLNYSIKKKVLNVIITVHYNGTAIDDSYIPSNIVAKEQYDNLLCEAIDFKPPQVFTQCFENGMANFSWNLSPDQKLSQDYLENSLNGWQISGNCTYENGTLTKSSSSKKRYFETHPMDYLSISNLTNGTQCFYEIRPVYDGCDCGSACGASASCTISLVSPATTVILPTLATMTESLDINKTTISSATAVNDDHVEPTTHSNTSNTDASASSVMFSTVIMSPLNNSSIITPTATTSISSDITSPTLFIITGILVTLLIGSLIIFCTILYIYKWKSTGKRADIQFLKMSQTIKMMKPPLSNNYCSTINIADESVCELPVNKVLKWIDNNNDFHLNGKSNSFLSIATSQMFAYIHKDDKIAKDLSSETSVDYIDELQLNEQIESDCNNACEESTKGLFSYMDDTNLNQKAHLSKTSSREFNPYYDENAAFNNLVHLNHSHTSLPGYIKENQCRNEEQMHINSTSACSSSLLQQHYATPPEHDKHHISKDGYMSSLPILKSSVTLAKSYNLLQSANIETTKKVSNNSDSDNHNHELKQYTDGNIDSGLNTDYSRQDAYTGLNSDCIIEALRIQGLGFHKSISDESKEMNCTASNSSSVLSLCSSHSDPVNTSSSGVHSSSLGYFELPTNKYAYFGSRTSTSSGIFSSELA